MRRVSFFSFFFFLNNNFVLLKLHTIIIVLVGSKLSVYHYKNHLSRSFHTGPLIEKINFEGIWEMIVVHQAFTFLI